MLLRQNQKQNTQTTCINYKGGMNMTRTFHDGDNSNYKAATKTWVRPVGLRWESWHMYGNGGNDTLIGGDKDDILDGGTGDDSLIGGKGNDTYYVDESSVYDRVVEYAGEGVDDKVFSSAYSYTLSSNVENLTLIDSAFEGRGNSLDNYIVGNNQDNLLFGGYGNDYIGGGAGNDYIYGSFDSDDLSGGDGNDYLVGDENTSSRAGNDILTGGSGNDTLKGGSGKDTLYGSFDGDLLYGESGRDYLSGGSGDDILDGGGDIDILLGGSGADTFYLTGGFDQIRDFNQYEDQNILISKFAYGISSMDDLSFDYQYNYLRVNGAAVAYIDPVYSINVSQDISLIA